MSFARRVVWTRNGEGEERSLLRAILQPWFQEAQCKTGEEVVRWMESERVVVEGSVKVDGREERDVVLASGSDTGVSYDIRSNSDLSVNL